MNRLATALTAASFALAATFAHAQTPSGDAGKGPMGEHRMMKPCSQEPDPAKCEARRKEMRANMKEAYESCKSNADKRGCMTQKMCAKAPDPAKCQANARERQQKHSQRMDEHQKAAEACTGKRGDDLMKCMQAQRPQHEHDSK
jgi:hypothetical protein